MIVIFEEFPFLKYLQEESKIYSYCGRFEVLINLTFNLEQTASIYHNSICLLHWNVIKNFENSLSFSE